LSHLFALASAIIEEMRRQTKVFIARRDENRGVQWLEKNKKALSQGGSGKNLHNGRKS
jgi:hypothetical protein